MPDLLFRNLSIVLTTIIFWNFHLLLKLTITVFINSRTYTVKRYLTSLHTLLLTSVICKIKESHPSNWMPNVSLQLRQIYYLQNTIVVSIKIMLVLPEKIRITFAYWYNFTKIYIKFVANPIYNNYAGL